MLNGVIIPAALSLIAILGIGVVIGILYKRSTRDQAYVRTGLGGKKVVLDGGSVVLPVFHSMAWVNLNTLRLEVRRGESDALITRDRMRVDIGAEFYVRVRPEGDSIALAAQTLGDRTNDADALRQLIEAKFVDALRSVAATMSLNDLQEKRTEFVKAVQETVAADLTSNGLELESVSLTRLDQTDIKHFNPNNSFDAEGLATLTKITEQRKKERNEVVRDTEVAIAEKDREALQRKLEIDRSSREAELAQQRDIANATAKTRAEQAAKEAEARQAEETARIASELAIAEQEAEAKRIKENANIAASRVVQQSELEAKRDVQIVAQESAIAVANKSREESEAKAAAKAAEALAVAADEKVTTAREVEVAERQKRIAVIAAEQEAQTEATSVTVAAEAERDAAENQAQAIKTIATAKAEAAKIEAEGILEMGKAQAETEAAMNDARNKLSTSVIDFELSRDRIRTVPAAIAESVKPIEKISDIRIFDTGGLINGKSASDGAGIGLGEGLAGQLLNLQANKPILNKILAEAGFAGGENAIDSLLGSVTPKDAIKVEVAKSGTPLPQADV
ncbi:flotillin family protein [Microvirga sp. 2MCAF38]|uniref:flotillin family protein n=1 Tax=Microvirga sp. 2MCAF38 TaxID=3232989 RepID=UPI003F9E26C1